MMDEEIRQALSEVREMKQMCGNINMKLTNIVTQRGQDIKKKLEAEYQRGLEDGMCDAWEAARKIVTWPDRSLVNSDTFDLDPGESIFTKYSTSEAIAKLKAYEDKQKEDDRIEVGDEVDWDGDCFIVTKIFQPRNMKEQCDGIDDDGSVYHDILMEDLKKTGKHYDIQSILEAMRK